MIYNWLMAHKKKSKNSFKKNKLIKNIVIFSIILVVFPVLLFFTINQFNFGNKTHNYFSNFNSAEQLNTKENSPTPTIYYLTHGKNLSELKEYDPLDASGELRMYTDESGLFSFKYPSNWSRILVEIYGNSKTEEFFEDGIVPILSDADGVGNEAFYINFYKSSESHDITKSKLGSSEVKDITIGGRPAIKSYGTYYVKPSSDTQLFIYTRYPDRINYQEILNSFVFKN